MVIQGQILIFSKLQKICKFLLAVYIITVYGFMSSVPNSPQQASHAELIHFIFMNGPNHILALTEN